MRVSVFIENLVGDSTVLELDLVNGVTQLDSRPIKLIDGIGSTSFRLGDQLSSDYYDLYLRDGSELVGTSSIQVIDRKEISPIYFSETYPELGVEKRIISTPANLSDSVFELSIIKDSLIIQTTQIDYKGGTGFSSFRLGTPIDSGIYDLKVEVKEREETVVEVASFFNDQSILYLEGTENSITTNQNSRLSLKLVDPEIEWAKLEVSISKRLDKSSLKRLSTEWTQNKSRTGPVLSGVMKDLEGQLLTNHSFVMIVPSSRAYFSGRTNESGRFEIEIDNSVNGFHCVFLSIFDIFNQVIVELDEPDYGSLNSSVERLDVNISREQENLIINEAFNPFDDENFASETSPSSLFKPLYDFHIVPTEFVQLRNMTEILHEVTPKVHVANGKFRVIPMEGTIKFPKPPLFFVNGIPTYDYDYILGLDRNDVESIGVIASKLKLKSFFHAGSGGIIEITMKDGYDFSEVPFSPNICFVKGGTESTGLNDDSDSGAVAFEASLHWMPLILLKKDQSMSLNFKTSYESGTYSIRVLGLTDKGEFLSTLDEIEITQPK